VKPLRSFLRKAVEGCLSMDMRDIPVSAADKVPEIVA
jgi:hypothetical protein